MIILIYGTVQGKKRYRQEKMYYTIFLNFNDRVMEGILPADAEQYFFDISGLAGRDGCGVSFRKTEGIWHVLNDDNILVTGSDIIEDGSSTGIEIKSTVLSGALFVCKLDSSTSLFESCCFRDSITIGSRSSADIQVSGAYTSREHAVIRASKHGYTIKNLGKNGIYINGRRTDGEHLLSLFDVVWIYGLKFAVTGEGISVQKNSYLKRCSLERAGLYYDSEGSRKHADSVPEIICEPAEKYNASVKVYPLNTEGKRQSGHGFSDIMKTSVFSGAALSAVSAFAGDFSMPAAAAVFAGTAVCVSGTWIAAKGIAEKSAGKNAREEREKYLAEYEALIESACRKYRDSLTSAYPDAETAAEQYMARKQKVCGRSDDDFLKIMLCRGTGDFSRYIDIQNGCGPEVRLLAEKYQRIPDIPVTADLRSEKQYFVKGRPEFLYSFAGALAVKISAFHSPSDVKMMFLYDESFYEKTEFVKWLPHVYSDNGKTRYCADSAESRRRVSDELFSILDLRKYQNSTENNFPHYIVFCPDNELISADRIRKYTESETDCGVTFIFFRLTDENIITVSGQKCFSLKTEKPDTVSYGQAVSYSRLRAANSGSEKFTEPVPEKLGFLEMAQNAGLDVMNISENYRRGKSENGISALMGTGSDRKPFYLDIHENGHGPHGLVAGTTGSGKSELILTFILSAALCYSPEQVAFVLIDYKGGGMSRVFENLPHTAGVLTNLEESAAETGRILVSLSSEIKKRQVIFKNHSVSHIDSYMKLYSSGEAEEALPHLVIVCDEFAELRKEQPEFISELVSISRVGRSLGVHLILATQRPSGVVDDEIKSNSSFRICLKVQDRSDSMEMLGLPDAAGIKNAGRAFIQTGSGAVPELVQTGYSGAKYSDEKEKLTAVLTGPDAFPLNEAEGTGESEGLSQLEMLTGLITDYCHENNISHARKLWKEPLKELITPGEAEKYGETDYGRGTVFTAGVTDDPENQKMFPSEFNLAECGNIIIAGAAGSGKSTFVCSALCSLAKNYSPDMFRFSVADFTGGITASFGRLVHCEEFYSSPEERELSELFDRIAAEKDRRKRLFAESFAADFSEYRETGNVLDAWLVCIDGFNILREMYPSPDEYFTRLSGESAKYGIYFMVTVRQSADIRMRTRQNFRTAVTFELADKTEYTDFLGIRPGTELPSKPGRGYLVNDRRVLVFQACAAFTGNGRERHQAMLEFAEKINSGYTVTETENEEHFCDYENLSSCDDYRNAAEKYLQSGRVLVWSDVMVNGFSGAEVFTGSDGALKLLLELKDEFSERNTVRKISGSYVGKPVTVLLSDLDDFCSVIYSEGNEDLAEVTEKFLSGGSGLGVRFVSGRKPGAVNVNSRVYRLFEEYSKGGRLC